MSTSSNIYSKRSYKLNIKKDQTPKAMLIIDMPESCTKCPLFNNHYTDMNCGGLHNRSINYPVPDNHRMEWCPLLPVENK